MKKAKWIIEIVLWIFIFFPFYTYAGIPKKINYQGYLTNTAGIPIHGTVQIVFSIYDVPTQGTALWTETQNVIVNRGVYSVILGEVVPINLVFEVQYYLGIRVGTDPEMTPRIPLSSVGYAYRAQTVEIIGIHTHSGSDIVSGTISEKRIDPLIARDLEVAAEVNAHSSRTDNPHSTTAAQVGAVALNQANSITSAMIVDGQVGANDINASEVQRRVSGSCASGSSIRVINFDGSVICEADDNSGGTVTQINTGTGLTGGPITTSGTISLSSSYADGSAYDARFVNASGDTIIGSISVFGDISAFGDINISGVFKNGVTTVLSTFNRNTFLGFDAGNSNTEGDLNTFIGFHAGYSNTTGNYNTFLGIQAGYNNTTGNSNTLLGVHAGHNNTIGNYNTFLGQATGLLNTEGSGNVFIGYTAGFSETGSNKLYIDNSSTSSPLIYGDFEANSVKINGSFTVTGTKSFIQPHAKDPTKEIVYIATEAPEALVIYRGTARLKEGMAIIELPEHFRVVASENGIQVQVTPTDDCNGIFVKSKSRERIEVKELMKGKSNAKFDYLITAIRAGFENHEPVVENTNFRPKENESAMEFKERYSGEDMNSKAMRAMLISNGILTEYGELNMEVMRRLGWKVRETEFAELRK